MRFLGWVDPVELEGLYAAASCFVFPSLLEGFGLPVLEAMARGVPVACSARGALAEVAGDAALRFDPASEAQIAARSSGCSPTPPRPRACAPRDANRPLDLAGRQQPRAHSRRTRARCADGPTMLAAMLGRAPDHPNRRGFDVNLRSGPQMREYEAIVARIREDFPDGCSTGGAASARSRI